MSVIAEKVTLFELRIKCDCCGDVVQSKSTPVRVPKEPADYERVEYSVRRSMTMERCDLCGKHFCEKHFSQCDADEDARICPGCTETHYVEEGSVYNRQTSKRVNTPFS